MSVGSKKFEMLKVEIYERKIVGLGWLGLMPAYRSHGDNFRSAHLCDKFWGEKK